MSRQCMRWVHREQLMIFLSILDRRQFVQRKMRPGKVVFNQPLAQVFVKNISIRSEIAHLNKFFLESAIESFINGVILRCFVSGEVVLKIEIFNRLTKIFGEFRTIVRVDINNFVVEQVIKTIKKISG